MAYDSREKQTEYQRRWRKANRDKVAEIKKRYRKAHPRNALLKQSRSSAKRRGIEHTLSLNDIPEIPLVCPILGTEFVTGTMYAMSIDRIDSSKGYIPGNIQIISRKANTMKSDATREELLKFANWIMSE